MTAESSTEGKLPSATPKQEAAKPRLSDEQVEANKAVVLARVDGRIAEGDHNITNPNIQG